MGDPRKTERWKRIRAYLIANAITDARPYLCWRCETEITKAELPHCDLGHVVDIGNLRPGDIPRLRLEHPSCNREAGHVAAREDSKTPRHGMSRQWVSAELDGR